MKTTTPETTCRRCKGEGMGQYDKARGACFLCGRLPGDHGAAVELGPYDRAESARLTLRAQFSNARAAVDAGEIARFLADEVDSYASPPYTVADSIRGNLRACLPDVAAKARAAFARIGVAL